MDWLYLAIANIAGLAFLVLAYRLVHKEKYAAFWYVCLMAAASFLCGQPWFQGLAKTWIISNVNSKLQAIGSQIDEVQKTTQQMQEQLSSHQKQITQSQKELEAVQTQIRNTQLKVMGSQADITNQYHELFALQRQLAITQTNLDSQEKKLEDVEYLVSNIFSKTANETIHGEDTNRICILNNWGSIKRIAFLLEHAAVPNSISGILWSPGTLVQIPILPIRTSNHNLILSSFDNLDNLKGAEFHFQYVADTRDTNLIRNVSLEGTNAVILFKDGTRLQVEWVKKSL
jgi:seryl-tRNA synthetase